MAPIVGRDQELALLLERWRQAKSGEGQVVLLTGEAGIGKSRITEALVEQVAVEPRVSDPLPMFPLSYQTRALPRDPGDWIGTPERLLRELSAFRVKHGPQLPPDPFVVATTAIAQAEDVLADAGIVVEQIDGGRIRMGRRASPERSFKASAAGTGPG